MVSPDEDSSLEVDCEEVTEESSVVTSGMVSPDEDSSVSWSELIISSAYAMPQYDAEISNGIMAADDKIIPMQTKLKKRCTW